MSSRALATAAALVLSVLSITGCAAGTDDSADPSTGNDAEVLGQTSSAYSIDMDHTYLMTRHGGTGGNPVSVRCNAGDVVIGVRMNAWSWVDAVAIDCAHLNEDGTLAPYRYTTRYYGGLGGIKGAYDSKCSGNAVVTRLKGRAATYVDTIFIGCDVAPYEPGSIVPGGSGTTGGSAFDDDCPSGHVLVGFNLRVGNYVDSIQGVCRWAGTR